MDEVSNAAKSPVRALRWWFTTEHPVLLGALRLAAEEGFDGHVWRLAWR
jgi:hypothetical protein